MSSADLVFVFTPATASPSSSCMADCQDSDLRYFLRTMAVRAQFLVLPEASVRNTSNGGMHKPLLDVISTIYVGPEHKSLSYDPSTLTSRVAPK